MVRIRGMVTSGKGVGWKYVSMNIYNTILTEILGAVPFNGTLNIVMDIDIGELTRICPPNLVKNVKINGTEFGGFYYWYCNIVINNNALERALALRPLKSSHPPNIIEVISAKYLRGYLNLKDGDFIDIELKC